jgi:polyhydroxyalkanoate synthesis repressor PhaR
MTNQKRIIKKYANRRLYDMQTNAYITLSDVKEMIVAHENFQVIDAKTGQDLTQNILLQIITEQESTSTPIFSNHLLQHFIRLSNEKSQLFLREYLEKSMALFAEQRSLIQKEWQRYQGFLLDPHLIENLLSLQKKWLDSLSKPLKSSAAAKPTVRKKRQKK